MPKITFKVEKEDGWVFERPDFPIEMYSLISWLKNGRYAGLLKIEVCFKKTTFDCGLHKWIPNRGWILMHHEKIDSKVISGVDRKSYKYGTPEFLEEVREDFIEEINELTVYLLDIARLFLSCELKVKYNVEEELVTLSKEERKKLADFLEGTCKSQND